MVKSVVKDKDISKKGGRWRDGQGRYISNVRVRQYRTRRKKAKGKTRLYEINAVARIRFTVFDSRRVTEADAFIEVIQGGTVRTTPQGLKRHKARYRREVVK